MWHSGLLADLPDGWSRFDSRLSCFFSLLYNFSSFLFNLFFIIFFPFSCFPLFFLLDHYSFLFFFFCNKRIPSNVYILILPLCMNCLTRFEALGKFSDHSKKLPKRSHFHTKTAQIRGFPREFVEGGTRLCCLRSPIPIMAPDSAFDTNYFAFDYFIPVRILNELDNEIIFSVCENSLQIRSCIKWALY